MKTLLSLLLIITLSSLTIAQTTAIPDANFEQALIDLGLDATIDGQVLTANIDTLTILNVSVKNISNLTGIEDFAALIDLNCLDNQLTNLDVSQNTALTYLICGDNQLTRLDVTQNTILRGLNCYKNQLTCLNLKNGNNANMIYFAGALNPSLACIEVDDPATSTATWNNVDPASSFSTSCPNTCAVGIEENNLSNLFVYPNPTTGGITIDLEETKSNISLRLTNTVGQVVLTQHYKSTNHINFDLNFPKGIYFLQLESDGEVITKKIIKQ